MSQNFLCQLTDNEYRVRLKNINEKHQSTYYIR